MTVTLFSAAASAQTPQPPTYPGGCETPVSQRLSETGCYLVAERQFGEMTAPVFWHLYTYPTVSAAEAALSQNGTLVQSLGKVWVFTLANQAWQPRNGERISVIGPLQTTRGTRYTARYMESTLPPGLPTGTGHSHAGAEAFYIVSGAQCLETPAGITVSRAGDSAIMEPGPPMTLSGVGTENRTAVLLVLHDSAQPWIARGGTGGWTPSGRCPR